MTHERGAAAVIGGGAALVLVGDLAYSASRWSGTFPRSFLIALGLVAACLVVVFALRLHGSIGRDRRYARWQHRGANVVLLLLLLGFLAVGDRAGGDAAGIVLGLLAGLASLFVVLTSVDLVRTNG